MWLTGKIDVTSQKQQLFTDVWRECRALAPGAMLSYKLRARLERFQRSERKEIVCRTLNGCAPLFVACQRGNIEVVEYLITVCSANVDQRGLYECLDDHSIHHVTPLWCAAVAGKLGVISTLVKHGADVNNISDTGSTPVRSACFMTHIDIVVFLVERGADISKPNYNGGTCLINSIQSVELAGFLLDHGADVNAQDIQKKTALHYAIQENRLETAQLLLERGADPFLRNKYDDDALQTACHKGQHEIFEYLIKLFNYSPSRIADGYELLGSTYLDDYHDIQAALQYWRKAGKIRKENGIVKKVLPALKPFQFTKEFETVEELEQLVSDLDAVRMQSLLICHRILGTSHKDMIFRLMYRGASFADSFLYQYCIDLWIYALELRINKDSILFNETCYTAQALVRLYLDIVEKCSAGVLKTRLKFEDLYYTINLLCSHLQNSMELLKINPVFKRQQTNFDMILKIITHIIFVFLHIPLSTDEEYKLAVVLNKIIRINPRTCQGGFSLLHLSVMKNNVIDSNCLLEEPHLTPFPSVQVVRFLLKCGAQVNATTVDKGVSPLYLACQAKNYKIEVIQSLIKAGGHLDQVTKLGATPLSLLAKTPENSYFISLVEPSSLKCLAARVIQKHKIPFSGEIPVILEPFVRMH